MMPNWPVGPKPRKVIGVTIIVEYDDGVPEEMDVEVEGEVQHGIDVTYDMGVPFIDHTLKWRERSA